MSSVTATCGKVPFASEALAWKRLFEIALTGPGGDKPVAVYRCGLCERWHLTRRP